MLKLSMENLYNGGAMERIYGEIQRAIENIVDPNTPAKKPRSVTFKMTIKPNEQRNMAEVVIETSSKLQAPQPLETSIHIGHDPRTGESQAFEMVQGENPQQHQFPEVKEVFKGKITAIGGAKC